VDNEILIKAVGDIGTGNSIAEGIGVLAIARKYGCDFLFHNIVSELKRSDLLLGNLEGSLSKFSKIKEMRLCGLPEMASSLRRVGFDVLSVANNHVLDHGPEIFKETITHCCEAGLLICGLRGMSRYYSEPVILERKGLRIGILAYNWVSSENNSYAGDYIAQVYDGLVNYTWNRDKRKDDETRRFLEKRNKYVIKDIRELRENVDIIIIMPHWGYEWTIYPPYGVVLEARSFIDAGADIILGSHPHIPQGIELYNNKIIAYSLGNFLFDGTSTEYRHGMIFNYNFSQDVNPKYELIFIQGDRYSRPSLASDTDSAEKMELVRRSSAVIKEPTVINMLDDDLIYHEYEKAYNKLKIRKIVYLLRLAMFQPSIIGILAKKFYNLLKIIFLRLKGEKIRW